jgi:HAD superfamily hydrolase (TIGR01484 family)
MDRTIIPNGMQPEFITARKRFLNFCNKPQLCLVYVTGRHRELVQRAIKQYSLPSPRYAITDVGSKIYEIIDDEWKPLLSWEERISTDWNGYEHAQLQDLFSDLSMLTLQPRNKQNTHKLSYYYRVNIDVENMLTQMSQRLREKKIMANLIASIDEEMGVGLLDILPGNANKLHSLKFLQSYLEYGNDEVVFAGDSGNDLPVLTSDTLSILVANASNEVKKSVRVQTLKSGNRDALYIANGEKLNMNGNYTAGVLEGIWHFFPEFRSILEGESF